MIFSVFDALASILPEYIIYALGVQWPAYSQLVMSSKSIKVHLYLVLTEIVAKHYNNRWWHFCWFFGRPHYNWVWENDPKHWWLVYRNDWTVIYDGFGYTDQLYRFPGMGVVLGVTPVVSDCRVFHYTHRLWIAEGLSKMMNRPSGRGGYPHFPTPVLLENPHCSPPGRNTLGPIHTLAIIFGLFPNYAFFVLLSSGRLIRHVGARSFSDFCAIRTVCTDAYTLSMVQVALCIKEHEKWMTTRFGPPFHRWLDLDGWLAPPAGKTTSRAFHIFRAGTVYSRIVAPSVRLPSFSLGDLNSWMQPDGIYWEHYRSGRGYRRSKYEFDPYWWNSGVPYWN